MFRPDRAPIFYLAVDDEIAASPKTRWWWEGPGYGAGERLGPGSRLVPPQADAELRERLEVGWAAGAALRWLVG